jgi:hypothetical protein
MNLDGKYAFLIIAAIVLAVVLAVKYVVFPWLQTTTDAQLSSPMLAEMNTAMDVSSDLDSASRSAPPQAQERRRPGPNTEAGPPLARTDVEAVRELLYSPEERKRPETLILETNRIVIGTHEYLNVVIKEIRGRYMMKHSGGVKWLAREEVLAVVNGAKARPH